MDQMGCTMITIDDVNTKVSKMTTQKEDTINGPSTTITLRINPFTAHL